MNKERAKQVLKHLRECGTDFSCCINDEEAQALDIAIESLDNEWVDVRDRLPHEKQQVLAQAEDGLYELCFYCETARENFFYTVDEKGEHKLNTKILYWKYITPPNKNHLSKTTQLDEYTTQFTIQAEMKSRWVAWFVNFLKEMEYCGNIGHSALLGFYADGDGDFRPKFDIGITVGNVKPIKKGKAEIEKIYDAG